jgi:hypothetical protein
MSVIRDLVHDTENEIMDFVFDQDRDDPSVFNDDDVDELDLDSTEGWDGLPLGDDEIMAGSTSENNFDRPITLRDEQDRQEAILRSNQELLEQMGKASAESDRQRWEQQKTDWELDVVTNPRQTLDVLLQAQQQNQELKNAVINSSMERAHERHGEDFQRAFQELTSMATDHPAARQIVTAITNNPDPGAALMNWHANGGAGSLRGARAGTRLPSLNSQTAGSRSWGTSDDRSGGWSDRTSNWGGQDEESGIFNSVFR